MGKKVHLLEEGIRAQKYAHTEKAAVVDNLVTPKPKRKPPETAAEVISDFEDTTSLLGVSHVLKRKNYFWLVAYMLCLAMALYQSWGAASEYFQQKSAQKYMIASKRLLPFPSVTVCSYAILPKTNFNFSNIPNYNETVDENKGDKCKSDEEMDNWEQANTLNQKYTLRYLRSISAEKRSSYSLEYNQFVSECVFGGNKCNDSMTSEIYRFNNPFYGNCFTFNPGFDGGPKEVDLHTKLVITLKLNGSQFYQIEGGKRKAGILIHSPGSAPVLDTSAVQDLFGGQYVEFTLKLSEKKFLKKSADNGYTCVDPNEMTYRTKSKYYTEESPYLYSVEFRDEKFQKTYPNLMIYGGEACMKSCEQEKVMEICSLVDPSLPVQPREANYNIDTEMPPLSCELKQELDMDVCGCKLPCTISQYVVNSDTTEIVLPDCEQASTPKSEDKKMRRVKFSMYFLSNLFESVEEEEVHSWSEFLGILGGNMSLWIGLCVLSLLELIELCWKLLKIKCRSQSKPKDDHLNRSLSATCQVHDLNALQLQRENSKQTLHPKRLHVVNR